MKLKFVRKHSPGPWKRDVYDVRCPSKYSGTNGDLVVDCEFVSIPDTALISSAPSMLDYLIERAEHLEQVMSGNPYDTKRKEFNRLIDLIRSAGVEIVEE